MTEGGKFLAVVVLEVPSADRGKDLPECLL